MVRMLITVSLVLVSSYSLANPPIETSFSPGSAQELVIKSIESAKKSIYLAGYSFTSKPIAAALIAAHRRGVLVQAVLDKSNATAKYSGATFLTNAGIPVHIDRKHSIMHNKYMVIDGRTVETGSFNYTKAAAQRNAENVLVIWDNQATANQYRSDWDKHWAHSEQYSR